MSKVSRMSFSPIENRYRRIVKALVLLVTFTRYREMESQRGIRQGRRVRDERVKKGRARGQSFRENEVN